MNVVNLIGRLGADPEVRHTTSGTQVANMRVATDGWANGEKQTEWHRVVCFGKTAEAAGSYLTKGSGVGIEGRIQTRKWQNKEGQDQYTTEIVAHRVHFVGGKSDRSAQPQQAQRQAPPKQEPTEDFDDDIPF